MYIYTANAFVYGHFKGDKVKEQVYEPDWRGEERTQYTINVANVLADVCPAGIAPSIQSAPLGFKPRVTGDDVIASYTDHVLRVVAHLIALELKTGRCVQLALEPEPFCFLETTDETIAYFRNQLYSGAAVEKLARLAHVPISEANAALRRHVGIVYDICHQAVEYENICGSLQKLIDGGVPIFKFQEAAALHIPEVTQDVVDTLKRYAKTIYLTQTIQKMDGKLTQFLNSTTPSPRSRRIRGRGNGARISTCRCFSTISGRSAPRALPSRTRLRFHKQKPLSRHLEVETYTWDVLPETSRRATSSITSAASSNGCAGNWCDASRVFARSIGMKVGFIGLGRMGSAMARRLVDGKHDVGVFNRTPEKLKPLTDAGAKPLDSVKAAANYGEAVFTMLADDAALFEVVAKPGGLLQSLPKGGIHICAGTHSVAAHPEYQKAARPMPDKFCSRRRCSDGRSSSRPARRGMLVAGDKDAVARCRPLFDAIARRTFEAGTDPVAAAAIKIANNFVLGCAIEAMGEGFSLIRKYDVMPDVFHDVMTDGLFACSAYKVYGKIIAEERYLPAGQRAILGLKDANLALEAGGAVGVPLPSGNVWRDRLVGAVAHGEAEHDWAVMAKDQARASGLD